MKRILISILLLAAGGLSAAEAVKPQLRNQTPQQSLNGSTLGQGGTAVGQFGSVGIGNGGLDHKFPGDYRASTGGPTPTMYLTRVVIGMSFATGVPDYSMGDEILPPPAALALNGAGWRPMPVATGEAVRIYPAGAPTPGAQLPLTQPVAEPLNYYFSPHAQKVFASRPGPVSITWISAETDLYENRTILTTEHIVSIVPRQPARRMFWTETPYRGRPVTLPAGIENVHLDFRPGRFEATQGPGGVGIENRTLWLDTAGVTRSLRAQLVEGRIFIEFLGAALGANRVHLGHEVVDVIREPVTNLTSFTVETNLGERLLPFGGHPAPPTPSLIPDVVTGAAESPAHIAARSVNGESHWYAERTTTMQQAVGGAEPGGQVVLFWKETGILGIQWPVMRNQYDLTWPAETTPGAFALNAVLPVGEADGVFADVFNANTPQFIFEDENEASLDSGRFTVTLGADGENRSLLLLQSGGKFWYVRVYSGTQEKIAALPAALQTTFSGSAEVGQRIAPPPAADYGDNLSRAGFIVAARGDAYHPVAYVNPVTNGFPLAELRSEIIPVNAVLTGPAPVPPPPPKNHLRVLWYRKLAAPSPEFQPLYWPSVVAEYMVNWPFAPREIIMASNRGTGPLTPEEAQGSIYFENDHTKPGYNPNEEHALMLGGQGWALRDDLNLSNLTSLPYVLVDYVAADGRRAISPFKVSRENVPGGVTFDYPAVAGTQLQAPMPLPLLPIPTRLVNGKLESWNEEVFAPAHLDPAVGEAAPAELYNKFTFRDRKHVDWIYRGPHAANPNARLLMQYRYLTQPGFAFPNEATGINQPLPVGTVQPYLRQTADGVNYTDTPETITYTPHWPDSLDLPETRPEGISPDAVVILRREVPVLRFGETLSEARVGLPDVRNNTSLQVYYQQSLAASTASSVVLFDPTRAKTHLLAPGGLTRLPTSIRTDSRNGRTYFQGLPPHLQERLYFNPFLGTQGALVLEGKFVDDIVGEDYLLLNVLSATDLTAIRGLADINDTDKAAWDAAIPLLSTTVERFDDTATPGTFVPVTGIDYNASALALSLHSDQAVDSYALATSGVGEGYVTLVAGNGEAFTPEGEPIALHVIRVGEQLGTGQTKVITASNPLDEKVTLRHSFDFAGSPEDYEFEWQYGPPANGLPPSTWIPVPGTHTNQYVVAGSGILALTDNYWRMRWSPKTPHPEAANWSEWTQPALVEGWIKRALAGINPFNQRVSDFFNNSVNTDVSILTQAGTRWEGNVALNLENIDEFGLIEIYETILNRGISLSISGTPATDYAPANDALLLASGYLADLYTILGDEAAADAANPTIAFDAQAIGSVADSSIAVDFQSVFSQTATARFAFQGQTANLLEEELALLRGRDDRASPGVELSPSYNRMYWNYTRGITAGEVIYALNYNIRERQEASADGRVGAEDAARMFPQAHGDAYGHYLTATKNYYRLLTNPQFTWVPRVEAVNVLGVPVQVDYFDERKFATAASRAVKTARSVLGLVHRQAHTEDRSVGWRHLRDGDEPALNYRDGTATSNKRTRHWGFDEWAARGHQGAYFHWVVSNAILPAEDTVNTGIQKIDRTTVPELDELALSGDAIQLAADKANAWLNPLGLAAGSQLFDISPADLAAGKTHFEQIYDRSTTALGNAFDTFDQATASTRLIRSLENQADDLTAAVFDQERAFNLRLIELYGTPYAGDIGPGKAYAQGYDGPDLLRFFYIDRVSTFSDPFDVEGNSDVAGGVGGDGTVTYTLNVASYDAVQYFDAYNPANTANIDAAPPYGVHIDYVIRPDAPVQYATAAMGQRQRPGQLQVALQDLNAKREDMAAILDFYNRNDVIYTEKLEILREAVVAFNERQGISDTTKNDIKDIQEDIATLQTVSRTAELLDSVAEATAGALADGLPDSIDDFSFSARGIARTVHVSTRIIAGGIILGTESRAAFREIEVEEKANGLDAKLEAAGFPAEYLVMAADVQAAYYDWIALGSNIDQAAFALQQARMTYASLLAEGANVQAEREIFRKRAAAIVQGYRTRDVAFRTFRTESLEQYQSLLDWATRYACLAARAYDYETGLLGSTAGSDFVGDIVRSRALGLRNAAGEPIFGASQSGDPGLSGLLARLNGDWSAVRGRLGFNNPDTNGTVFSLRGEHFRIPADTAPTDADSDANNDSLTDRSWKEQLQAHIIPDLRADADVALHCLQVSASTAPIPGIVIPLSSTVTDGFNFFGRELAGGDHHFTATAFATKIHSTGLAFTGYVGMDPYAIGQPTAGAPASAAPNALSATPYVFLIPTGQDIQRTPPLGDGSTLRRWDVQDYAMPLPYNIGAIPFNNGTGTDTLGGDFLTPRKHQAFRAVDNPAFFYSTLAADYTNRRLVGRSVWNTGWKIVIPANTLLSNSSEGLDRFLKSVTDIKLYLRTYSYSGN